MGSLSGEYRVIALIILLVLSAMAFRVGWVLGPDPTPSAFAQDGTQTEEESQQIGQQQERDACEDQFDSQAEAQDLFETAPEEELFQDLDSDGDGIACELVFGEQGGSDNASGGQQSGGDQLMQSGGHVNGPVPAMSDGACPKEFPAEHEDGCHK